MPWMMPNAPTVPNKRHAAMNHGEHDYPVRTVQLTNRDGVVFSPSNSEIVQDHGWLGKTGDKRLSKMQHIIDIWYAKDPLFNEATILEPFVPPKGIDHIICAYGVNVPTPVGQVFEEDKANPGYFLKVDEIINDRGDVRSSRTGKLVLPVRQRYPTRKSGDGTVDYASLSWCHSWFGDSLVNITKIPANRNYEADEIERFDNVDVMDPKQLSATEKRAHGFNTFFSRRWIDVNPDSGLQRPKSMQVWEFHQITHRDSVSHALFIRIWKDMLEGTASFSRAYMATRQKVLHKMWQEIDQSGTLDSVSNDWLVHAAHEGTFPGSNGKLPTSDHGKSWIARIDPHFSAALL
jgi:hypothetical protein